MELIGFVCVGSMAVGLGVTPEEWEELKGNVDDSFWVMRVIGYPPLPTDHDGFSCGVHKSVSMFHLPNSNPLTIHPTYPQGLRLFNVWSALAQGLQSQCDLGSSGPMTRRGPYRCSSSSPDYSSSHRFRMEVPSMKPLNRVFGSTLIQ